ncbi:RING finger protein ETP1 like protein [Termitomyces sp. J132]|nr:RING finger protein ETP1 like protein [Termitomyces sp. J132]
MNKAPYAVGKGRETNRGTLQATFIPHTRSKSGTTNLPEGIVHVFREAATTDAPQEPVPPPPSPATEDSDGVILGVLAVPAYMTPSDFLTFVAPAVEGMAHLRLIRDSVPNRSIAVIKFFNPADAAEFVEAYNGKPFNSMDPETCSVVHVLSVVVDTEDSVSQAIHKISSPQSTMYELPTCPCLSKWGDSRCPVCRYSQILQSSHPTSSSTRSTLPIPFANPSTPTLSSCSSCSSTTNLWICLICGNIGCGRYGRAHAHAHYQSTTHLYALELETQRVWDYAGDGYVHRLIQNKADGKLVELPSAASSTGVPPRDGSLGPTQADALSAEKIEAIGIEYSYLLTSQLESQRSYYEDEEKRLKNQLAELKGQVDRLGQQLKEDAKKREDQEQARLAHVMKEKSRAEARAEKATEVDKELKEDRAVSEGLMKNMNSMKERVERADKDKGQSLAKIHELEDQLRDVMFFLETRMKIESGEGPEAELAGGTLEVSSSADVSSETKKKKSRKR